MLTDVKIWLYDLPKCGYYTWRGNAPTLGGMTQTFDNLTTWATGKVLGQTSTFTTGNGDEETAAYFLNIHKADHGDFLIGLWNRLPGNTNNISSVGMGDVVGSASAAFTKIDVDRIPGFATYFWIMPSEHRIACVSIKHEQHGLKNFERYMLSFLSSINPQHVVTFPPDSTGHIRIQYRSDQLSQNLLSGVYPRFSIKLIPLKGDVAFLRQNVALINKVVSKTILSSEVPDHHSNLAKLMHIAKYFTKPPPLKEEMVVKLEFPMQFTLAELNETIEAWQDGEKNRIVAGQDDIGFHMGANVVKWLSKSRPRIGYQMDVSWIDEELVDVAALLKALQVHRSAVLALG